MQVIYTCLVIVFFITGTVFGYVIGKNGFVQIGTAVPPEEKERKLSEEEQLANMMNYDGKVRKEKT